MDITIYSSTGKHRLTVRPEDGSTQQKELQGDNVLSLSFTSYEHVSLDVNDWCQYEGERYWLMEAYEPQMKGRQEWQYELKLYGIESLIKRFLVLNTTDGDSEPVFTLTATPAEHVKLIVDCINAGMDNTTNFKVGVVEGSDLVVMDYEGTYCDEALKTLAEKVGTEWWTEGTTVNLCKCRSGELLELGYGNGLTSLEQDRADDDRFYSRLYPIGSSRNIDPETYGHPRLMLPNGQKYVDVSVDKYGVVDRYEADAFAGIYPRYTGKVSSVRSEEKKDDNGNPFTIYYIKDDNLPFNPDDYMLAGKVLRISFQEGSDLAGLGEEEDGTYYFECNWHSATKEFELITIWPYDDDTQLPNATLSPKKDNRYIVWNLRMPSEFITLAEQELKAAVDRYNAEKALDISVYKGQTDHVWVEETGADLYIGRQVRLKSAEYFPKTGYRDSRITKLSRRVNLPGLVDLEISEALSKGGMEQLTAKVENAKNYAKSLASGSTLPGIIRSWDNTPAADTNLYSARRSRMEFLSKKEADRAKGKLTLEQVDDFGQEFESGVRGARIDDAGNAELLSTVVRELLRSVKFTDGLSGEGWQLWTDGDGVSHLTVDKLTVRQLMTVLELLIEKIRSVGGSIVVSAANGKIKGIEESSDGESWELTFDQATDYAAHDLMRCATFSGSGKKDYWVEVSSVATDSESGAQTVTVKKSEFTDWGCTPAAGDETVLMGNTEDAQRQNLILISATEDGEPRVDVLDGVKAKSLAGALRARLGNLDGIKDSWFPSDKQPQGNGLYSDNAYLKGTFLLETGEDVKTKFEITEGKLESSMTALRDDVASDKGYLSNPSFGDGMSKWWTENEAVFWLVGNKWIWANQNVLTKKGASASLTTDEGRKVVRIRNKYIKQTHGNLRYVPAMDDNSEGKKDADGKLLKAAKPVYLSFIYRCAEAGTLKVGFENVDKSGFTDFNSMDIEEEIGVTDGYVQWTGSGLWNGTGDFKLRFTGDIYLYMLVLSTDKVEALTYKYQTLLSQSDKLVNIAAKHFDADGNVLSESGIMVKAEGTGLYAQGADGKVALIGVGVEETDADGNSTTVIKLTADHIQLEGLVTANGNFKILADGSIEAVNGKFTGTVNATDGYIGGFIISSGHIGAASVTTDADGNQTITDDRKGLFLYDDMIGFNGDNRQAILGTWNTLGIPILCRLEDTTKDEWLPKYGMTINVTGSLTDNVALSLLGGYVSGFGVKTETIGLEYVTQATEPGTGQTTLERSVNAVLVSTQYYYRAKEKDDSGNAVSYATKTRQRDITLPAMTQADDGHMIWIKRGVNDGSAVHVIPSTFTCREASSSSVYNTTYADKSYQTYLVTDRGSYKTDYETISSNGDAMCLVFFAGLSVTIDGKKYAGAWVQWKNPRDW